MFNKKQLAAIAHHSYVNTLFIETLYTALLNKEVIAAKDCIQIIDVEIKRNHSWNHEKVEALQQLKSLLDNEDGLKDKISYFKKTGVL